MCVSEDELQGAESNVERRSQDSRNRESGRGLTAVVANSFARRAVGFYLLQLTRIWAHLPEAIRRSCAGCAYGRHLHALVCRTSDRRQYVATYFLRNRPELELMRRLLDSRPAGTSVSLLVLGCSKGAEVYSIAWAIRSARPDLKLHIRAVDISQEIVGFAKKGVYSCLSLDVSRQPGQSPTDLDRVIENTHLHQQTSIFERVSEAELHDSVKSTATWPLFAPGCGRELLGIAAMPATLLLLIKWDRRTSSWPIAFFATCNQPQRNKPSGISRGS